MKKLLVLSLSVLVSLFASCSSDDDSSGGDSIVGSWQTQSISFDGGPDEANDCDRMDTLIFTETTVAFRTFDISVSDSEGCELIFDGALDYEIDGNMIILEEGQDDDDENTFVVNGDTLIITFTDIAEGFDDEVTVTTYRRI